MPRVLKTTSNRHMIGFFVYIKTDEIVVGLQEADDYLKYLLSDSAFLACL